MTYLFSFLFFCGDAALWLSLASVIAALFTPLSDLLAAVPVMGFGCMLAAVLQKKRKYLGWFGLLPALAALRLCTGIGDWLLLLPPIAYLSSCILRGTLVPDRTEVYYRFGTKAGAAVIGGFLCILAGRLWGFSCAVISLASGVFLMRMQRHNPSDYRNPRLLGMELGLLAVLGGVCTVLSRDWMLNAGLAVLKQVYFLLIYPLLNVLLYLLMGVLWLMDWILARFFYGQLELPPQEGMQQIAENAMEYIAQEPGAGNPWLRLLLQLAAIAVFLTAGYFVFRYLRSGTARQTEAEQGDDRRTEAEPEALLLSRPGLLDLSPEACVRRAYGAYCRRLERGGIRLIPSDTTRSIYEQAGPSEEAAAAELRELYLRARYTRRSGLTPADARRAAALSRKLRT